MSNVGTVLGPVGPFPLVGRSETGPGGGQIEVGSHYIKYEPTTPGTKVSLTIILRIQSVQTIFLSIFQDHVRREETVSLNQQEPYKGGCQNKIGLVFFVHPLLAQIS